MSRLADHPDIGGERFADQSFARLALEIVERIGDGFFAVDRDWRVVYANRRACEMWSAPAETVIGRVLWERFPELVGTEAEHRLRAAVASPSLREYEIQSPFANRWLWVRVAPLSGGLTGVYWRDIDERRQAEQAPSETLRRINDALEQRVAERTRDLAEANARLSASEESQRALFSKAPIAMHAVDAQRRIIDVNDNWLELLGYAREEVIGRPISDFHVPGREARHEQRWRELLSEGELQPASRAFRAKSGAVIDTLLSVHLQRDAAGNFLRGIVALADVTARRQAEAAAERERELSALLIESSIEGIIGLDRSFRYTVWNPAMEAMSGLPKEKALGRAMQELRRDVIGTPIDAAWRAAMEGHRTRLRDLPYTFPRSGRAGFADVDFAPLYGPDRSIVGGLAFLRDTTERRQMEDQLRQAQKMEAVGQLTGGVAHDFNNILTVIMGNLDNLQRHLPDEPEPRRMIGALMRAANRAATLTHRLLAFARRQPLEPTTVDANQLVMGMSDLLRRTLGEEIDIETALSSEIWPVHADANELENALLNLAVNARDAMPRGGRLKITTGNATLDPGDATRRDMSPGAYVVIAVSDTGTGMTPEVLARAFEPFFTTKEVGQGTGLGLPQVYGFVTQSGGHVKIDSALGQGTTVRLYLPRLAEDERVSDIGRAAPVLAAPSGDHLLLVVEDDEDVRHYSAGILSELGYRVVEAADGPTALRVLAAEPRISLLFTDVVLPGGLDGIELAKRARAIRPALKVLFTTGYSRNAIIESGRLDPSLELIAKPFGYASLADKIGRMLEQSTTA